MTLQIRSGHARLMPGGPVATTVGFHWFAGSPLRITHLDRTDIDRQWQQVTGGLDRAQPWLTLCRLPWSLAVAADPLAGALLVGAGWGTCPSVLALMLSVVLMHAGAVALNDWHDYKTDRVERPDRPLATGAIGRWWCLAIAMILLSAAWTLMSAPGLQFTQLGAIVVSTVLVYEFLLKGAPAAKVFPGIARALGLLSGMMLVPVPLSSVGWGPRAFFMAMLVLYVLGTMVLAARVADDERRAFATGGGAVMAASLIALAMTRLFFPLVAINSSALIWIGLIVVLTSPPLLRAILRPSVTAQAAAAGSAMLGTLLVDATAVTFVRGSYVAIPVALLLLPVILARHWLTASERLPVADAPSPGQREPSPPGSSSTAS